MSNDYAATVQEAIASKKVFLALRSHPGHQDIIQEALGMIETVEEVASRYEGRADLVTAEETSATLKTWESIKGLRDLVTDCAVKSAAVPPQIPPNPDGDRYDLPHVDKHPVVGVVNGDGWRVKIETCDGKTYDDRVVGWAIQDNGTTTPICLEDPDGGFQFYPTLDQDLRMVILYHPDEPEFVPEAG